MVYKRRFKYRRWKGTQATHLLWQCPACGAHSLLPSHRTGPTGESNIADHARTVRFTCDACSRNLTAFVPKPGARPSQPAYCATRLLIPGTLPAIHYPRVEASDSAELHNRVRKREKPYRPYLRQGLLNSNTHDMSPLELGFDGFPVRPVIEQTAYMLKLGLPAEQAILAALATEAHYALSLHPNTMMVEQLIGMLSSIVLPPVARPVPPNYFYDYTWAMKDTMVTFAYQRRWYAWARSMKLTQPESVLRRLQAVHAAHAQILEPLRVHVRACLTTVRRYSDYQFPPHMLCRYGWRNMGLLVWQTKCGDTRVDNTSQWKLNNNSQDQLVMLA